MSQKGSLEGNFKKYTKPNEKIYIYKNWWHSARGNFIALNANIRKEKKSQTII